MSATSPQIPRPCKRTSRKPTQLVDNYDNIESDSDEDARDDDSHSCYSPSQSSDSRGRERKRIMRQSPANSSSGADNEDGTASQDSRPVRLRSLQRPDHYRESTAFVALNALVEQEESIWAKEASMRLLDNVDRIRSGQNRAPPLDDSDPSSRKDRSSNTSASDDVGHLPPGAGDKVVDLVGMGGSPRNGDSDATHDDQYQTKVDQLRMAIARQCSIIRSTVADPGPLLTDNTAHLYIGVDIHREGLTRSHRLYSPLCEADHPLVEAFSALPGVYAAGSSSKRAVPEWACQRGELHAPLPSKDVLEQDISLSPDDRLIPMTLASFAKIQDIPTIDIALRFHGPRLMKEARKHQMHWVGDLGSSEMSGRTRWIRDIDGIRKQVGPGCAWTDSRMRSYINLLALKYPKIAIARLAEHPEDTAGYHVEEGKMCVYYISQSTLEVFASTDVLRVAQALQIEHGRKFKAITDASEDETEAASVPAMLLWLECRLAANDAKSGAHLPAHLTASNLIAREEEFETRIQALRSLG